MIESNYNSQRKKIVKLETYTASNPNPILKRQIVSAEQKAVEILREARMQADELIEKAKKEVETIRQTVYQESRENVFQELIGLVLEIKEERENLIKAVEKDILQLSLKIAQKIIGEEVKLNNNNRLQIIYQALREVDNEVIRVRINVNDLPLVENLNQQFKFKKGENPFDFVADSTVKEGGCIIDCQTGTKDFRLETQFMILEKALLEKFSENK